MEFLRDHRCFLGHEWHPLLERELHPTFSNAIWIGEAEHLHPLVGGERAVVSADLHTAWNIFSSIESETTSLLVVEILGWSPSLVVDHITERHKAEGRLLSRIITIYCSPCGTGENHCIGFCELLLGPLP